MFADLVLLASSSLAHCAQCDEDIIDGDTYSTVILRPHKRDDTYHGMVDHVLYRELLLGVATVDLCPRCPVRVHIGCEHWLELETFFYGFAVAAVPVELTRTVALVGMSHYRSDSISYYIVS